MKKRFNTFYFCMLFVFTFGAIGAGAWWVIGATIQDGMRAKEWVRVRAELVSYGQGNVSTTGSATSSTPATGWARARSAAATTSTAGTTT